MANVPIEIVKGSRLVVSGYMQRSFLLSSIDLPYRQIGFQFLYLIPPFA